MLNCPHCDRSFGRIEHQRRHIGTVHAGQRFSCQTCGRAFNRRDSCRRHEAKHTASERLVRSSGQALGPPVIERVCTVNKTCQNCATARIRCAGGECCPRCLERGLQCSYPLRNKPPRRQQHHRSQSNIGATQIQPTAYPSDAATSQPAYVPTRDGATDAGSSACTLAGGFASLQEDTSGNVLLHGHVRSSNAVTPGSGLQDAQNYQGQPQNHSDGISTSHTGQSNIDTLQADPLDVMLSSNSNTNWLPILDDIDLVGTYLDISLPVSNSLLLTPTNDLQTASAPATSKSHTSDEAVSAGIQSPAAQTHKQDRKLYADGQGARSSFQFLMRAPRRVQHSQPHSWRSAGFPLDESVLNTDKDTPDDLLNIDTYDEMQRQFQSICCTHKGFYKEFERSHFPSHKHLQVCLQSYITHFSPIFPLIHHSAWIDPSTHWLLFLQAVTIGARLSSDTSESAEAFSEFAHRAMHFVRAQEREISSLHFAQASILSAVIKFNDISPARLHLALSEAQVTLDTYNEQLPPANGTLASQWRQWIVKQSHVRMVWLLWFVRFYASICDKRLDWSTSVTDTMPFLSSVKQWSASSAEEWHVLCEEETYKSSPLDHASVLRSLFVDHKKPVDAGAPSLTLMIYAVVARVVEVGRASQRPHDAWKLAPAESTEQCTEESAMADTDSKGTWLPSMVRYANWRNSACDCFDLIHWTALSRVALSQGYEEPHIFHLHFSRVVLLCPLVDLDALSWSLLHEQHMNSSTGFPSLSHDSDIFKWLTQDEHKSRLGVVHAGAMFWHARRYSAAMFYEPYGIYACTVVVATYGFYLKQVRGVLETIHSRTLQQSGLPAGENLLTTQPTEYDAELVPDRILLDRPVDDEIVQTFIRQGHTMKTSMTRADDISVREGYQSVIKEGMNLLQHAQYASFSKAVVYHDLLANLLLCT